MAFWIPFLIGLALSVVSYLIMPKPKAPKPEAAKQMDDPVADAGIERPVVFGTMTVKQPNCLWFGDKRMKTYRVKV